uniref:Putative secreted protein n=1 Tax=Ixodes ricinus TaxID=34613 RepID=A0A6B0URZ1_IXORI
MACPGEMPSGRLSMMLMELLYTLMVHRVGTQKSLWSSPQLSLYRNSVPLSTSSFSLRLKYDPRLGCFFSATYSTWFSLLDQQKLLNVPLSWTFPCAPTPSRSTESSFMFWSQNSKNCFCSPFLWTFLRTAL